MYCSRCGLRQPPGEAFFCARCGLQQNTQAATAHASSHHAHARPRLSARQKGVRQGVMLMLSTLLVVPLVAILGGLTLGLPVGVVPASAVICLFGGALRIAYALLFEDHAVRGSEDVPLFVPAQSPGPAPRQVTTREQRPLGPGRWKTPDTAELRRPASVTEHTTGLLHRWPAPPDSHAG